MKQARGFTLVEVLVVLIIAGLASSILLQALGQVYRLQERFGVQLAESQSGAMRIDWLRQVLQGLQTDFPMGKQVFAGQASSLKGLSISSLAVEYGAPRDVTLTLDRRQAEDRTDLVYEGEEGRTVLFSWRGQGGAFAYLDAKGDEHAVWPPQGGGTWPQLPSVILLRVPTDKGLTALAAVPRGSTEAKRRQFQLGAGQ